METFEDQSKAELLLCIPSVQCRVKLTGSSDLSEAKTYLLIENLISRLNKSGKFTIGP